MVDNLLLPFSFQKIFDGDTAATGAKLTVFDASTNNVRTTYTNNTLTTAHPSPVVADSAGVMPAIYIGVGEWKFSLTNENDVVLQSADNITGPLDTSGFLTGTVSPSRSISSVTSNTTLTTGQSGDQINGDTTGGDFTITLPSAVTLGNSGDYLIKNTGTGILTVDPTGGQTIDGKPDYQLYNQDAIVVRSDGGNYMISEAYRFTNGIVTVTFSTTIDIDVSLYPLGVDYQITATDDFTLTTSNDRVGLGYTITIIQDATGGRTPTLNAKFKGDASIDERANAITRLGVFTRTTSDLDYWGQTPLVTGVPDVIAENQQAQNTTGGATTVSADFQDTPLNTVARNKDTLATLNSNRITLPIGTYYAEWSIPGYRNQEFKTALYNWTADAIIEEGTSEYQDSTDPSQSSSTGAAVFTLTTADAIGVAYKANRADTQGFGRETSLAAEVYGRLKIWRI